MASKLGVMDEVQAQLDDSTLTDLISEIEPMLEMAQEAEEARSEALDAVGEAMSYHEERQWEDRNQALETAVDSYGTYIEKLGSLIALLSEADGKAPPESLIDTLEKSKAELEGLL